MIIEMNWDAPLEVYNADGEVVEIKAMRGHGNPAWPFIAESSDGRRFFVNKATWEVCQSSYKDGWFIRNAPAASTPTPDERAVALVKKMAEDPRGKHYSDFEAAGSWVDEARAIVAALEPVDGDLVIAREMVAESDLALRMPPAIIQGIKSGAGDDTEMMKLARAALARGRQIEKEGK